MQNLQNNTEVELSENTDFFNTLEKAEIIREFIKSYTPNMTNSKIIALFGEWGSGKSSVLQYIERQLEQTQNFSTLYFNSWEYEKDQSLALSLFDALWEKIENKENVKLIDLRKTASRVLGAVTKGVTINIPFMTFSFKEMLEHMKSTKRRESYYMEVQNFKKFFKNLENAILEEGSNKKLIVFLDDLDRCEPENILNLLSAIKLFFTLGSNRIMFVCGVDKEAVHNALLIKYNDVIKANEYLEKIFDFSFNMPNSFDVKKALEVSLKQFESDSGDYENIVKNISDMFKAINFTNPRHIKKIINKYIIFRNFSKIENDSYKILKNLEFKKENTFFLLVFFYLIVLYEFYKNEYDDLKKVELKTKIFLDKNEQFIVKNAEIKGNAQNLQLSSTRKHNEGYFIKKLLYSIKILDLGTIENKKDANSMNLEWMKFINFFLPMLSDSIEYNFSSSNPTEYLLNLEYLNGYKGYCFGRYVHDLALGFDIIEPIKILELIDIIDKLS